MGPDGWIYATHGFKNTSHLKVLPQKMRANRKNRRPKQKRRKTTGVPRSELDWGFSLETLASAAAPSFASSPMAPPWNSGPGAR